MNYPQSIKTCFTKYAVFSGRATRSEYWWFLLFYMIFIVVASMIKPVLQLVVLAICFLPLLGVSVRRLHDTNRSGWFYLLAFIPLVGAIILIIFFVQEGTKGPNLYGNPPVE